MVTDLDGTVVRSDFSISPATLDALDLVRASGIAFVIATARTPQGLEHFQALAERTAIAVCCSGAIGWRSREKTRTWMEELTPVAIRRVVEIAVGEGAGVASFDGVLWRMTEEYFRLSPTQPHGPTRMVVDDVVLAATPCCTMAVRLGDGDLESHRGTRCRGGRFRCTQSCRSLNGSGCDRAGDRQGHRDSPSIAIARHCTGGCDQLW